MMLPNSDSTSLPIIYGPIESRRLGQSLGVNLLGSGAKACSFDCPYCHLGPTELRLSRLRKEVLFPSPQEVAAQLGNKLRQSLSEGVKIDNICLSGNGEPTLHPQFEEVVHALVSVRNQTWTKLPLVILSNGARLDERKIVESMNLLDERMLKFDAGNDRTLKLMNAPLSRVTVSSLTAGIRSLKDVILQSFFCQGSIDNTGSADLDDWIESVGIIRPKQVHIHGLNRSGGTDLVRCSEDTLYTIASKLERRTQIKSLVFP